MTKRPRDIPAEITDRGVRRRDVVERDRVAPVTRLPTADAATSVWRGDEEWVSTLPDPHDTSIPEDVR